MRMRLTATGRLFSRLMRDERGGEVIEYAMTLGFLAAGGYLVIQSVGDKVVDLWRLLDKALGQI